MGPTKTDSFSLHDLHKTAKQDSIHAQLLPSMRICFVLLLAVTALIAAVSGSSVNLRASQKIQSGDVVQDKTSGRELRGDLNTDEATEERMNFDFVKKLVAKVKGDPLKSFAKKQTRYAYNDGIFDALHKKFLDPDALYKTLNLHKPKNRSNIYGVRTGRYNLYENFLNTYLRKFPDWRSTLK